MPGEFYAAATRPPNVYRGNPFQIEVGLAYGATAPTQNVTPELLAELIEETDARTVRQFLINTFNGLGADAADKIIKASEARHTSIAVRLKPKERATLFDAMKNVNVAEGQSMDVLRYANRVPLQFQHGACAITQTVMTTNWRSYGLSQTRGSLPKGPVTVMVHVASVWVPFTSESKEAIASYPEIQKELRLALQSVGRKLGMYLRRRLRVKRKGNGATSSSAISVKSPRRSAKSTAPTARSALRSTHESRQDNGRPKPMSNSTIAVGRSKKRN